MKRLQKLLSENPGYYKKGSEYLASKVSLKAMTVNRFKKSDTYKQGKKAYIQSISNKDMNFTMTNCSGIVNTLSNQTPTV